MVTLDEHEIEEDAINLRDDAAEMTPPSSNHGGNTNDGGNLPQIMAMLSNFGTSYNVVSIGLVIPILEAINSEQKTPSYVASTLLFGMMAGQVLGGYLGDTLILGRLGALKMVMILQIIGSLASALAVPSAASGNYSRHLAIWRFVLGVGAGGVYPLVAVLSAETPTYHQEERGLSQDASKLHRVVLTFSMQGVGFICVPLLALPLMYLQSIPLEYIWRILLGVGCLPGLLLLCLQRRYYQALRRHEIIPTHEDDSNDSDDVSAQEEDTVLDSSPDIVLRSESLDSEGLSVMHERHWYTEENLCLKLLGTALTWYLFDVLFYGNTLFQSIVIKAALGPHDVVDERQLLQQIALNSLILTGIELPGYLVAALTLGKTVCGIQLSVKFVMTQGFAFMAVLYMIIGVYWRELREYPMVLVLLYGMTFFFANFGPNTTTFVLPSLIYSPEHRSTLNGISAACGKFGALTGSLAFTPIHEAYGPRIVMLVCSGIGLLSLVITQFFVSTPNNRRSSLS